MRLEIFHEIKQKRKKTKFKRWSACPACGHCELIISGADQLCTNCDWANSLMLVEAGQMDNIDAAFKNHFLSETDVRIQRGNKDKQEPDAKVAQAAS